jgi:hypothetical protein
MGGDGGVIASNRRYMRGAGTADCTADTQRSRGEKQQFEHEDARERMRTCALTNLPLQFGDQAIVACPYGRLYGKEAAVEALLRRKQSDKDVLGPHIRGLKDLYEVRFHLTEQSKGGKVPTCPVTGVECNGQLPIILLVPGKKDTPNVVSQRAFKIMGNEELQTEYGPFSEEVRLAPPVSEMEEIVGKLEAKRVKSKDKSSKKSSKKEKKRREESGGKERQDKPPKAAKITTLDIAKHRVQEIKDETKSSDALSSLFTSKDNKLTQKERNDNLFARC